MNKTIEDYSTSLLLWQVINIIGFLIILYLLYLLIKVLRKKLKEKI